MSSLPDWLWQQACSDTPVSEAKWKDKVVRLLHTIDIWRERALCAEAERDALRAALKRVSYPSGDAVLDFFALNRRLPPSDKEASP